MSQIDIYLKSYHLPHPQTSATYVAKSWDLMPPSATANYRPSLILLLKSLRVKFSQINTLQKLLSAQRQQQPGDPGGRLKNIPAGEHFPVCIGNQEKHRETEKRSQDQQIYSLSFVSISPTWKCSPAISADLRRGWPFLFFFFPAFSFLLFVLGSGIKCQMRN